MLKMPLRPQTADEARRILSRAEARSLEPPDEPDEEDEESVEEKRARWLADHFEPREP